MTAAHTRVAAAGASRRANTPASANAEWPVPGRFDEDPYPGRPRILFVGAGDSSHTHAWIDLLAGAGMNVRLFALPGGVPPDEWPVRTYVTAPTPRQLDRRTRGRLYPAGRLARAPKRAYARFLAGDRSLEERWLAQIVRDWRPDVVHTLGIAPAGELYFDVRRGHGLEASARWIVQTRGGSDLALSRFDEARAPRVASVMRAADCLLSDNPVNFDIALDMGVKPEQLSPIGIVPGTGGVDVDALAAHVTDPPSARQVIVWPKAYESPWSKALPVFEALTQYWHRLPPCEIHMLATVPETQMWFHALPASVKRACRIDDRIPRHELLPLLARSRVMLAPSLVDGTPNSMFEAMATGALPVLSPLETIRPLVRDEHNVLFARNLYPDEIGEALVRAMTDDRLVDDASDANRALVRTLADRATIRPRVVALYDAMAGARSAS
jgi:glycosyltransferase involved in cell wall biosynthesis